MTPMKCQKHELRPGEFADSPRYTRALIESQTCWRCRVLATLALAAWRLRNWTTRS